MYVKICFFLSREYPLDLVVLTHVEDTLRILSKLPRSQAQWHSPRNSVEIRSAGTAERTNCTYPSFTIILS